MKILYIVPSVNPTSGVSKFLYNYLETINKNLFTCEILSPISRNTDFVKEYTKLGVKVHFISSPKNNLKQFKKDIKTFFDTHNDYDIVHCNVTNTGYFYLKEAKKHKIPIRILHSHATKSSDKFLSKIRNAIITPFVKRYSTNYAACSNMAGKYLFKNKDFFLIHNAMDISKFDSLDIIQQQELKQSLNIKNELIIGFVGRLVQQKNPFFLIEIAKSLLNLNKTDFKFLIIGTGVLENEFKQQIVKNNLSNYFVCVGEVLDATKYYSIMDCFVLPSLFEGLPLVAIEAQLSKLPCLLSNEITSEVIISNQSYLLSIDNSSIWASKIINVNKNVDTINIKSDDYNINIAVKNLENYYIKLIGDKNAK